jgi:6-phosphogluconolactonase
MIRIFNDSEQVSVAAADLFVQAAKESIDQKGRFTVALTGGTSPIAMHKLLTLPAYAEKVDWNNVFVFWGDERWVPLDDPKSNAKMAYETLLDHVSVPAGNVFPMWSAEHTPEQYAGVYEQLIKDYVGDDGRFDLILLGMGDDGHTASLFPGTAVLTETTKWVDAYYLQPQSMHRITLTAPLINQADRIVFMVYGPGKAPALHEVLEGDRNPAVYPAQLIRPVHGEVLWLVDKAAATALSAV